MTDKENVDEMPECFEVRCLHCNSLATSVADGGIIYHKCRRCGRYFVGQMRGGRFVYFVDRGQRRPIMSVSPPSAVG